jgi:hypothetical protein
LGQAALAPPSKGWTLSGRFGVAEAVGAASLLPNQFGHGGHAVAEPVDRVAAGGVDLRAIVDGREGDHRGGDTDGEAGDGPGGLVLQVVLKQVAEFGADGVFEGAHGAVPYLREE